MLVALGIGFHMIQNYGAAAGWPTLPFFLARSEATSSLLINININISIKRKNDAAVAVPPESCLKWNICMLELRRTKVNKTWRCQLCCRCEEVTKGGLGGRTK